MRKLSCVHVKGVGLGSFADGFVDLGLCLNALEKQHGTTKHDVPVDCAVEGNRALAMCFKVRDRRPFCVTLVSHDFE